MTCITVQCDRCKAELVTDWGLMQPHKAAQQALELGWSGPLVSDHERAKASEGDLCPACTRAVADMVEGYSDGLNLNYPEPSDNRSESYRHGFANGRDDRAGRPRRTPAELRQMGDLAITNDSKR